MGHEAVDERSARRYEQKWGFGMAPIKPAVQERRIRAVQESLEVVEGRRIDESLREQLSVVKGLFSRAHRQDQWDWFTVWGQLGRPGGRQAYKIAEQLHALRRAPGDGDSSAANEARQNLVDLNLPRLLRGFPNTTTVNSEEFGYIYILSTREARDLLKVGYTMRSVEDRVREINTATGIAIPYGVRAMWVVKNARDMETAIHRLLDPYRVRKDREFFAVDFKVAFKMISNFVKETRLER